MNEPSAQLWKKLNEVSDKLQKVTEQLVEANTLNKGYHAALEQMRVKVELLEQQKFKDQGAISMLKWGLYCVPVQHHLMQEIECTSVEMK